MRLEDIQKYPLEIKIAKTENLIHEWVNFYGINKVYIAYSGGKDSEVLLNIASRLYPNIKAVFCNTSMEYPETIKHVLYKREQGYNIDIIKPKMSFAKVVSRYGYPIISKEQSRYLGDVQRSKSKKLINLRLGLTSSSFCISKKWRYLINEDFKISDKCCDILKKQPFAIYEKNTGRKPIIATLACESRLRFQQWLKLGCNSFECTKPKSKPMSFWLEKDIWDYVNLNNIELSAMYTIHGAKRTGCYGCLFGIHIEQQLTGTNRIAQLSKTHPKLFYYLNEKLDYKRILNTLNIPTTNLTINDFL